MCETTKQCAATAVPQPRILELLGIDKWMLDLAIDLGIMARGPRGKYCKTLLDAALADLPGTLATLDKEQLLNYTTAASRAHVPIPVIKAAVEDGRLTVRHEEAWKYGWVKYVRAGDVDELADYFALEFAARTVESSINRAEGARKAAQTRKINAAKAAEAEKARLVAAEKARIELVTVEAALENPNLSVVRLAGISAGIIEASALRSPLRGRIPGAWFSTSISSRVSNTCKLADVSSEQAARLLELAEAGLTRALKELATPKQVSTALKPATLADLEGNVENIAGWVEAVEVASWSVSRPDWLLEAEQKWREKQVLEEMARIALQEERRLEREQLILSDAVSHALKITDGMVADLLGLPEDLVHRLRPMSGKWTQTQFDSMRKRRPSWASSLEDAQKEADRLTKARAAREDTRKARRARRDVRGQGWRQTWARELSVPVDIVPEGIGRPTPGALRALKEHAPRWYLNYLQGKA